MWRIGIIKKQQKLGGGRCTFLSSYLDMCLRETGDRVPHFLCQGHCCTDSGSQFEDHTCNMMLMFLVIISVEVN